MIKRLFFMLSLFAALLVSAGATAQGATKEMFFKEVKKNLRSTLSYGMMKDIAENAFDINHLPRMLAPGKLNIAGEKRAVEKVIKDVLVNSYGLSEDNKSCLNPLFYSAGDSGNLNYFSVRKHYCDIYDPKAYLCGDVRGLGIPSKMLFDKFEYIEKLENDCPEILSYYRDYKAFVDAAVKEIVTKKHGMKLAEAKRKKERKLAEKKRRARLRAERLAAKKQRQRQAELVNQEREEQKRQEELDKRMEEERKLQAATDLKRRKQDEEISKWKQAGFDPSEVGQWTDSGFKLGESTEWKRSGFSAEEAKEWENRLKSGEAAEWKQRGFSPEEAGDWKRAGVEAETALALKKKGKSPNDRNAVDWARKSKSFSPEEKVAWEKSGYSDSENLNLVGCGVTAKDISSLKRECPGKIYRIKEKFFGLADPYDVAGKCYFYSAGMRQRLDRHTALFATGRGKGHFVRLTVNGKMPRLFIGIVKGEEPYKYRNALGIQNIVPSGRALFYRIRN